MKLSRKNLNVLTKSFLLILLLGSLSLITYAEPELSMQTMDVQKQASVPTDEPIAAQSSAKPSENKRNLVANSDQDKPIPNSEIVKLIVWLTAIGLFFCFAIATYFVRDHSKQLEPYLGEGLLLQTIVVIMIVQCVLALALARILNATEIGTIYGGIIGYIFGRRESPKNVAKGGDNEDAKRTD
jgi:hypothetical protein